MDVNIRPSDACNALTSRVMYVQQQKMPYIQHEAWPNVEQKTGNSGTNPETRRKQQKVHHFLDQEELWRIKSETIRLNSSKY